MFVLPFITVLREGLEAVAFVGGVGIGMPASSFPLAVFCGLLAGIFIGYLIYKGGNQASLQNIPHLLDMHSVPCSRRTFLQGCMVVPEPPMEPDNWWGFVGGRFWPWIVQHPLECLARQLLKP